MLYDDRANVLAALVVLGLILAAFLNLPAWSREVSVLGSPLTVGISQTTMMSLLLVSITCAGTDTIVRLHPRARRIDGSYSFVTWTVPALTTALAASLLPKAPALTYEVAGFCLTGLMLILVISAEYVTIDPADRRYAVARLLLNAWAYLLALAVFVLIYSAKARSLISATAVTAASTLLALELLRGAGQGFGRTALYAAIAGLSTGQVVWAMNYMRLGGVSGGLVLLLGFYIATGVALQTLQRKLTRRVLLEYAAVALVGLFVLLRWGP
jgi:hypothetical protein